MARYDKVVPKNGVYRATLAADYDPAMVEKIIGIGHDANGRLVKGAGVSGITGVLVLTKAYRAGSRVDPMTHGEIVEFGPTAGVPGTDFGQPGKVYYSDATGNIIVKPPVDGTTPGAELVGLTRVGHTVEGQRLVVRVEP